MNTQFPSGSGRDDDSTPTLSQTERFNVLEELQKALDASRAEIDGLNAATSDSNEAREAAVEDDATRPVEARLESAKAQSLRARLAELQSLATPWLETSPSFVPDDRNSADDAQSIRAAAARNSTEPMRSAPALTERLFGPPAAPVFVRSARPRPDAPAGRPRSDRRVHDDARGVQSRQADDDAWRDDVLRRLMQRPPEEAELAEVSSRLRRWHVWTGHVVLAIVAAGVAFYLVQFLNVRLASHDAPAIAAIWSRAVGTDGKAPAPEKNSPRLITSALSGAVNRPVALGVNVNGAAPGASLVIRGMPSGSRMTAGGSQGEGTWQVPIRELAHAAVMPPADFVGTMNLSVDLRLADGSVADRDVQQLKWTAGAPDFVVPKPVTTTVVKPDSNAFSPPTAPRTVTAPPSTGGGETGAFERQAGQAPAPASRRLERDEIANLLRRGQSSLQNGDIAAARLLLRRAAEAADAQAALALAATYDPAVLKELGAVGAKADIARARDWYRRAADAGSAEAQQRLQLLSQQSR
jgi:hypothetical protein